MPLNTELFTLVYSNCPQSRKKNHLFVKKYIISRPEIVDTLMQFCCIFKVSMLECR